MLLTTTFAARSNSYNDLPTTGKKGKLKLYGHVSRSSDLAMTILQSIVRGSRDLLFVFLLLYYITFC